jgi:hypothetical protein
VSSSLRRPLSRTIDELVMLRELLRANGSDIGAGWDIVVLRAESRPVSGNQRTTSPPGLLCDTV